MLPSPQFGGQLVSVQVEQCLNARHKDAGCRRCAEACPTQAITLANQDDRSRPGPLLPQLDPEQCVRCGLCLHHCPTDVFTQPNPPETKLGQTLANLPEASLGLVCPQQPNPAMTAAPVTVVVRHQRCLASLSISQLIDFSQNGQRPIWLDDTPCAECPIGQLQPIMAQTAAATRRLFQAFGRPPAIYTPLAQPDRLEDEPRVQPLIEGDQPKLSRRGLLGSLGQLTHQAATLATTGDAAGPPTSGPRPVSQRLPYHLPPSRQRLRRQLAHLGTPAAASLETTGLPLTNVTIAAQACSACRLCARFCPTGALHFVADAESFGLSFDPALCLDCGICAVACPENAVNFSSHLSPAALVADKARWLMVGHLTACAGCGESTARRDDEADNQPGCYSCRQSGGPAAPLKDPAGLMADLLKHKHSAFNDQLSAFDLAQPPPSSPPYSS